LTTVDAAGFADAAEFAESVGTAHIAGLASAMILLKTRRAHHEL
jgi:hypothetical protein